MKHKTFIAVFLLFISQIFSFDLGQIQAASEAPIYYVDINAMNAKDDSTYGSQDNPWKTLGYAIQQLQAGDTLLIREGIYPAIRLDLTGKNSGTAEAPITIKAYPDEQVVWRSGGNRHMLTFMQAHWWIIDGIIFEHQNLRIGTDMDNITKHITLRNCVFRNSPYQPLLIWYAEDVTVENCHFRNIQSQEAGTDVNAINIPYYAKNIIIKNSKFEDISSDGIQIGNNYIDIQNIVVENNEFWINNPDEVFLGEEGIDIKRIKAGPVIIRNNIFHGFRPTVEGQNASGSNGAGLVVHREVDNIIIEKNLFYDSTFNLVINHVPAGGKGVIVRNNILKEARVNSRRYDVPQGGVGIKVANSSNVQIYHNTLYDNDVYLKSWSSSGISFKNNVVVGGKSELGLTSVDWDADHNAWSKVQGNIPSELSGGNDYVGENIDLDSNLKPLSESFILNSGETVGVTDDFKNNSRTDGSPDIGAYEITASTFSGPYLHVNPVQTEVYPGSIVEVKITLSSVENLYGLQVNCDVDPSVLSWQNADFDVFFTDPLVGAKNLDTTAGNWIGAISQKNPAPALSGSGSFATLTFEAVTPGTSTITCEPLASDRDGFELPLSVSNNMITVLDPNELSGRIEGVVTYQGRSVHTGIQVTATGSAQKSIETTEKGQFVIDSLKDGEYNIMADADLYLPSCSKTYVGQQTVNPELPTLVGGDADDDDQIRINDATLIGSNFGLSTTSTPIMDSRADINTDGRINVKDLSILSGNFGKIGCQEPTNS